MARSRVIRYDPPDDASISPDYTVTVDGEHVHTYDSEVAAYAIWSCEGPVEVKVTCRENDGDIVLKPHSGGRHVTWDGSTARFTLERPVSLCFDPPWQKRKPLFLFASPPEEERPAPDDPNVHYFAGGRTHDAGTIRLKSNETLYIEGGAVVRANVEAVEADHVRIRGRGVLDGSGIKPHSARLVYFGKCTNLDIAGITTVATPSWTIMLHRCKDVHVHDIKEIGWVVGSDGVDVVACHSVLIERCFFRNNDDCVVVKAFPGYRKKITEDEPAPVPLSVDNVEVRDCVFFNAQAGNAMEIGFELRADSVKNIHFHDCDVIAAHGHGGVFTIHNGDRAMVENVLYENIRVEHFFGKLIDFRILESRYSRDPQRGRIRNVTLRNIRVARDIYNSVSLIGGWDHEHTVENVTIEDLTIGRRKVTNADELQLFTNEHVSGVTFG